MFNKSETAVIWQGGRLGTSIRVGVDLMRQRTY
jgi:hypothetical protein